jgi:ABC-type branched-subunit amino acid transport system ATPase component
MLKVEDISVQFGLRTILEGVNLAIEPGEIVGIIGPNGCGKTTLLNTLSGFVTPRAGSILFKDDDITASSSHKRADLGLGRSFQNAGVFKEMTLEENLMLAVEATENLPWWWRFSKKERKRVDGIIEKQLKSMDLLGHKHSLAGVLSGGQLRLLEMLKLKISGGDLLLIDEPTAGVAPVMRNMLAEAILELQKDKKRSIVIVEHDLKFLFNLVDRVIVLVEGEVYMQGKPKDLQNDPKLKEVYFGA